MKGLLSITIRGSFSIRSRHSQSKSSRSNHNIVTRHLLHIMPLFSSLRRSNNTPSPSASRAATPSFDEPGRIAAPFVQVSTPQATQSLSPEDRELANRMRNRCDRFRILIIGRANAGKTTILQKVCGTTEAPIIRNAKGRKVCPTPPWLFDHPS